MKGKGAQKDPKERKSKNEVTFWGLTWGKKKNQEGGPVVMFIWKWCEREKEVVQVGLRGWRKLQEVYSEKETQLPREYRLKKGEKKARRDETNPILPTVPHVLWGPLWVSSFRKTLFEDLAGGKKSSAGFNPPTLLQ